MRLFPKGRIQSLFLLALAQQKSIYFVNNLKHYQSPYSSYAKDWCMGSNNLKVIKIHLQKNFDIEYEVNNQ